jgi:ABC-type uncharacterized transport system ATPase subunit
MTNESGDCLAEVSIVTASGTQYEGRAEGINQIETIHRAIASGLGVSVKLLDHTVNHIRQDCKEVLICLEDGHQVVNGRASANTVLRASAEAYVDALRKLSVSSS